MATTAADTVVVREKLILGGLDLIDREGTEALSVRKLAQAAERTSMCVYTKFGSRGSLLMAVYERTVRELLVVRSARPDRAGPDPADQRPTALSRSASTRVARRQLSRCFAG